MKPKQDPGPRPEAPQTVRLQIHTEDAAPSIRISFTDQRLTAHGGLIVWSHFLRQKQFRQQLRAVLPHDPTSPNAYDPTAVALGYVGGILCGADKLSRVAWLQSDAAVAEVLAVEAISSQSTLSRFFGVFTQKSCQVLGGLHARAAYSLPTVRVGYTLDLDSWALLHEDGHQAGVAVGYTQLGLKPCHRPLIAGLGQLEKCELNTLRWRLFGRAAGWSRAGGKSTLKLAVRGASNRNWWREMLAKNSPRCPTAMQLTPCKHETKN